VHDVRYVGRRLHRVRCLRCRQQWEIPITASYLQELPVRIATKPLRLGREARRDPFRFARTLPARVLTKPLRIVDEVAEVVGLVS
jgi:hypothetical protein